MPKFAIKRVLLQGGASGYLQTKNVLDRLSDVPVDQVDGIEPVTSPYEREMGKDTLCLLPYKGRFFKPCPGTNKYICCGYQILNVATNCPLDCSYCILQAYLKQPYLRVFVNLEEELEHVMRVIDMQPESIFRVGTGEFTDSLAIDPFTGWSDLLLPLFSSRKNAVLELKTKTKQIERLLRSKYRERIIVSWSLNSPYIATHEEHGATDLRGRLEAARQCQSEGFTLGFHFDPLIAHPKWKEDYLRTLELMDKYVDPKGIIWFSLGSLRFMPEFKGIVRKRHPKTRVLDGEFVMGLDRKMRYFKPIRIDLYAFIRENLEKWHSSLGLYLCMESDDVWQKGMGWSPKDNAGLKQFLDRRVAAFFH